MSTPLVQARAGGAGAPREWALRTAVLPALAVAALPKCPLCVMVVLGALGLSHPLHETVFSLLQGTTLLIVVSLLVVRHRRAPEQIVAVAAGACGVLLGLGGFAPPAVGYAGAILLALIWLLKPGGRTAPSCGCAS
jgi:hypothetical protein